MEASHTVEILREAGPSGMHVAELSKLNRIESTKLGIFLYTRSFQDAVLICILHLELIFCAFWLHITSSSNVLQMCLP
jgi:hypothetical protein